MDNVIFTFHARERLRQRVPELFELGDNVKAVVTQALKEGTLLRDQAAGALLYEFVIVTHLGAKTLNAVCKKEDSVFKVITIVDPKKNNRPKRVTFKAQRSSARQKQQRARRSKQKRLY